MAWSWGGGRGLSQALLDVAKAANPGFLLSQAAWQLVAGVDGLLLVGIFPVHQGVPGFALALGLVEGEVALEFNVEELTLTRTRTPGPGRGPV